MGAERAIREWRQLKRELGEVNKLCEYMKINQEFRLSSMFVKDDCRKMLRSLDRGLLALDTILKEMD